MAEEQKPAEDWIQKKWRPMMAVLYMAICACDFILFPVAWTAVQAVFHGGLTMPWQPLTLQGGGLIHIAFGAILGITAYGRTQEKLMGANNGGLPPPVTMSPSVIVAGSQQLSGHSDFKKSPTVPELPER